MNCIKNAEKYMLEDHSINESEPIINKFQNTPI